MHAPPPSASPTSRADEDRLVEETFRRNARTFSLAARLLPRRLRLPVATLYWYCRTVDEIADRRPRDDGHSRADALLELADARESLTATMAGRPHAEGPHALLWRRLADVDREFGLDWDAMAELLDGAQWDLDGRPIETSEDLLAYSDLVAGSVGAMMLPLLVEDPMRRVGLEAPARALGVAMQITNILRDVGEDRKHLGRVYIPRDVLLAHGLSPESLEAWAPVAYGRLCEELMVLAEDFYARAGDGIRALPFGPHLAVLAASRMYREILNEVRAAGYDNISRRAVVPMGQKLLAAAGGYHARRRRLLARAAATA